MKLSPVARTIAVYTGIRVLLFAVSAAVLALFTRNPVLLLGAALIVSMVLAYPLARRQRDQLTEALEARRVSSAQQASYERHRRGLD